ncbi:MCP four helix bundle domain-containing protein [Spirosoma sp. KUDC1026]|uniref:MCP four helix bundle domain-containing protein n=1 Tax=Spirosoma sp. KUDC1026 TaxID=2745947 RepID=UPI00159BB051|nr:MCP four helix bundle domain-containing protein [Spirosoma sp. KUDC1026]QKZ15263.1 MCP four helix bundle domain-containing protein [Spirosoma sp. KUDC1026]
MTPSANTRSRTRSVLLIIYLIGLILTSIFLSRRRAHNVQETSSSIFEDRLLPTNMLVNLTATVYRKRLLLETYVLATPQPDINATGASLNRLNRRTDSLLTEFSKTSLTVKEAEQLRLLKQQLAVYNQLEGELSTHLLDQQTAQKALFAGSGSTAFGQVAQTLDELANLQVQVGEELLAESRGETNYIYVLTALQIGLVLLIGLSLFWYRF